MSFLRSLDLTETVQYERMLYKEALMKGYDGTCPVIMKLHWNLNIAASITEYKNIYAHSSPPPGLDYDFVFLDMNSSSSTFKQLLGLNSVAYNQHFDKVFQYFGEYTSYVNGGNFHNQDMP